MKQTNYSFHISGIRSQFVQRRGYPPYYAKPLKTLKFTHMRKYVHAQVHVCKHAGTHAHTRAHAHTHTQFLEFEIKLLSSSSPAITLMCVT